MQPCGAWWRIKEAHRRSYDMSGRNLGRKWGWGKLHFVSQPHFGAKCENATHTPKSGKMESTGTPKNSEDNLRGQISSPWCVLYINGKVLKCRCPKWSFGYLQPKLWAKEGPGVKLPIWLPTIKSRESTSSQHCLKECDMALESSRWELQLWFRARPDPSLRRGTMTVQSPGTPTQDNFGTPIWESREKEPFGCSFDEELQSILYGGRWWLPPSLGRGESCVSKCPWLVPTPKGVPEC